MIDTIGFPLYGAGLYCNSAFGNQWFLLVSTFFAFLRVQLAEVWAQFGSTSSFGAPHFADVGKQRKQLQIGLSIAQDLLGFRRPDVFRVPHRVPTVPPDPGST